MTQIKKDAESHQSEQKQHLEEMNEQLRLYLLAAHKDQFMSRASAIRSGQAPSMADTVAPAMTMQAGSIPLPPVDLQPPATPFEQAAAQAFDALQQGQQATVPRPVQTIHAGTVAVARSIQHGVLTPQQLTLNAARRVVPIVSAYTRLPLISQRRRYGRTPTAQQA
jgi:hypothetical protein